MRIAIASLLWLIASSTGAQPLRDVEVQWYRGQPRVSFSAKDLADERVRSELQSALRKRLVITVAAHVSGTGRVIEARRFDCFVTRDLWEDGYLVRTGGRTERMPTLDKALDRCLVVKGLFVHSERNPGRYGAYRGKKIYFSVRAEFNPISKKQCRELIRPSGNDDAVGPITVSIVRRRICQAERTVVFRSKEFEVPP